MNKAESQINRKTISNLFLEIKKDNLENFENILNNNPTLINFKNKKKENILFYAFEKDSKKIINYILNKNPELIKEKNIIGLTILHDLVIKNKDLSFFLTKFNSLNDNEKMDFYKSHDPNGNNILFFSTQNNNIEQLKILIDNCPNYKLIQEHQNEHGQNLAHFLAINFSNNIEEIKNKLSLESMKKQDFLTGYTPLMIAASNQNKENFENFFNFIDSEQVSYNGNHLFHLAASNNLDVINFLIENKLSTNKKNKLGQSALGISISKNKFDITEKIFELFKNEIIYAEDLVSLTRISSKNKPLFMKVISNENNQFLNENQKQKFLEGLFLHAEWDTIENIKNNEKFKGLFVEKDFGVLFAKSIAGRKDMQKKIDFLIKDKITLSTKEAIAVNFAISSLPKNQIIYVLEKTKLLEKIKEEDKPLVASIFLERNIPISHINFKMNESSAVQTIIKNNLKSSKINLEEQINKINDWLLIIKDENSVFKHYGKLIANLPEPFHFIEKNKKTLNKEKQKKLIFYTITSIIKNENPISEEVKEIVSNYQMLLKSVIEGIIKYNKVPQNKEVIRLIKEKNFIPEESLINLIEKNKNYEQVSNFVADHFDLFNISSLNDDLIVAIGNHPKGSIIFENILKQNRGKEDILISKYLDLIGQEKIKSFNHEFLDIKKHKTKKIKDAIEKNFFSIIENHEKVNTDFLNELWNASEATIDEVSVFANSLFGQQKFKELNNLQKSIKKHFHFKELDFAKIDFINLHNSFLINDNTSKDFFDFLSQNKGDFTTKQIGDFLNKFKQESQENNISVGILGNFLNLCDVNILKKCDQDLILETIKNGIIKYENLDFISKSIEEDNFEILCESITKMPINILIEIQNSGLFEVLDETTKININKDILDYKLTNGVQNQPKKKFKI